MNIGPSTNSLQRDALLKRSMHRAYTSVIPFPMSRAERRTKAGKARLAHAQRLMKAVELEFLKIELGEIKELAGVINASA